VSFNRVEIVEYLILQGANINAKEDFNIIPLHNAAVRGHFNMVKYLVNHGADIHAQNTNILA